MAEFNFKSCNCYKCGSVLEVYKFDAVWKMRVNGVLHDVPLKSVPCHKCSNCDCHVITGESDEAIQYWYWKYVNEAGLNKLRHKLYRFILRRFRLLESWFYRGRMWQLRRERQS